MSYEAWGEPDDDYMSVDKAIEMGWLSPDAYSKGAMDVLNERIRQTQVGGDGEGWSEEHDDEHKDGAMAAAAAAYAYGTTLSDNQRTYVSGNYSIENNGMLRDLWPASWSHAWWKPKDRRQDLVRAAALLIAEIERLDRAEDPQRS